MLASSPSRCLSVCVASAVLSLALGGCGSTVKPLTNLVPVSGTVSVGDRPLAAGTVHFVPEMSPGQPAVGEIKEGRFTMVTTVSSPGVVAGKYKVRIEATEASGRPDAPPPTVTGQPYTPPKSLIAAKYNDVSTSGLTVVVKSGMPPPDFQLEP